MGSQRVGYDWATLTSLHFTSESQGPSCKPWKLHFLAMSQSWVPSNHNSTAICPGLSSSPDHQWRVFTASWPASGPCLKFVSIFNWSTVDLLYFEWTMLCSFLLYSQVIQLCTHFFRSFPVIVYYKILKSFLCYTVVLVVYLFYICACSSTQSCSTLCDPMGCSLPNIPFHGTFQQGDWSRLPFSPPGHLPDPGIEPSFPESPVLAGRTFTTEPPGKPCFTHRGLYLLIPNS